MYKGKSNLCVVLSTESDPTSVIANDIHHSDTSMRSASCCNLHCACIERAISGLLLRDKRNKTLKYPRVSHPSQAIHPPDRDFSATPVIRPLPPLKAHAINPTAVPTGAPSALAPEPINIGQPLRAVSPSLAPFPALIHPSCAAVHEIPPACPTAPPRLAPLGRGRASAATAGK